MDKPVASLADRRAALETTPRREPVQTPAARVFVPPQRPAQPSALTTGAKVIHPKDAPVRTTQGSRFQSALQAARDASATRAAEYQRAVKIEKVNEFVPTANPPAGTVRAGSETQP